jgi:two-component system chemotaxis response regulator CheY
MKHVLIIDDSPVVRKVARRIVEGLEMRISEADNCADALTMCAQEMPDAILLDGSIEGMKSLDFVRRLRQSPSGETPRVIFVSAENDVVYLAGAMRSGANMFMVKPFTKAELASRLEDLAA